VRFLGVGETTDLGDMYLRLAARGHEVRVYVGDERSRDVMRGMLTFTSDWNAELDWIRAGGGEGIILFETSSDGETQDQLRRDGFNVIGGSALGDRLESDRTFGQKVLREHALQTAPCHEFRDFRSGADFVRETRRRYVFKLNGSGFASTRNYVGEMSDGTDMIALLAIQRERWDLDEEPSFVLMDHLTGVEIGVGAFFNGERFLMPANLDWEHKRFFPGDVGELTGEMGTLVTYRGAQPLFDATLARMAPMLRESGYCGYINLNNIINDEGIWPLEFTCRFGYPGFPILDALHAESWDDIFARMLAKSDSTILTHDGFSLGVVITVPPFPYGEGYEELGKGMPISFAAGLTEADRSGLHYAEVTMSGEQLVTAGMIGYVMVVTARGETAEEARDRAYALTKKIVIPTMRYRNDIGSRFIARDRAELIRLGWLHCDR